MLIALMNLLNLPAAIFPLAGSILLPGQSKYGMVILLSRMTIVIGIGFVLSLKLNLEDENLRKSSQ